MQILVVLNILGIPALCGRTWDCFCMQLQRIPRLWCESMCSGWHGRRGILACILTAVRPKPTKQSTECHNILPAHALPRPRRLYMHASLLGLPCLGATLRLELHEYTCWLSRGSSSSRFLPYFSLRFTHIRIVNIRSNLARIQGAFNPCILLASSEEIKVSNSLPSVWALRPVAYNNNNNFHPFSIVDQWSVIRFCTDFGNLFISNLIVLNNVFFVPLLIHSSYVSVGFVLAEFFLNISAVRSTDSWFQQKSWPDHAEML